MLHFDVGSWKLEVERSTLASLLLYFVYSPPNTSRTLVPAGLAVPLAVERGDDQTAGTSIIPAEHGIYWTS